MKRGSKKLGHRVSIMIAGTADTTRLEKFSGPQFLVWFGYSSISVPFSLLMGVSLGFRCLIFASYSKAAFSHRVLLWEEFPEKHSLHTVDTPAPISPPCIFLGLPLRMECWLLCG